MRFLLLSLALVVACDDSKPAAPAAAPTPSPAAAPAKAPPVAVAPAAIAPAQPSPPAAPPAAAPVIRKGELDEATGKPIVDAMNEICGDTYCEGSYEWTFKSVSCKQGKCVLAFSAKHHDTGKVFDETTEFRSSDEPVDATGAATEFFQQSIDQAIAAWEAKGKK